MKKTNYTYKKSLNQLRQAIGAICVSLRLPLLSILLVTSDCTGNILVPAKVTTNLPYKLSKANTIIINDLAILNPGLSQLSAIVFIENLKYHLSSNGFKIKVVKAFNINDKYAKTTVFPNNYDTAKEIKDNKETLPPTDAPIKKIDIGPSKENELEKICKNNPQSVIFNTQFYEAKLGNLLNESITSGIKIDIESCSHDVLTQIQYSGTNSMASYQINYNVAQVIAKKVYSMTR